MKQVGSKLVVLCASLWLFTLPAGAQQSSGHLSIEAGQPPGSGHIETGQSRAAAPATPAGRFVIAVGASYTSLSEREPLIDERFRTIRAELDASGFDLALAGELTLLPWLAAGVGLERTAKATLDQDFDLVGFNRFTARLRDGAFDPRVLELYAVPSYPLHRTVRVFATIGVGVWRVETENTVALLFDGVELSRETVSQASDGIAPTFGAGVDVWPHPRAGFRVGYRYMRLDDGDEVDEPLHSARFLALLRF